MLIVLPRPESSYLLIDLMDGQVFVGMAGFKAIAQAC